MQDYINLRIDVANCSEDITDLLAAFLADEGFETFVPDEKGLTAYIKKEIFNFDKIKDILSDFPIKTDFEINYEVEPGKDWNEEWEKNYFQPIVIADKCVVHSSFHKDVPQAQYSIMIDPKMAFGTGHHATTSGMINLILEEDFKGKYVIDMGTGTGILSFLCKMRGASEVVGIEIDRAAYDNAVENAKLNNLEINMILGDASALKDLAKADFFMANINRNIITEDLHSYALHLKDKGKMFLSGFYRKDIPIVMEAAGKEGLSLIEIKENNDWVALKLSKG